MGTSDLINIILYIHRVADKSLAFQFAAQPKEFFYVCVKEVRTVKP
jgi:hypothetical protein